MTSLELQDSNNAINLPGPSSMGCNTWNRDLGNTNTTNIGSQPPEYHQIVPTLRSNIEQMRKCISIDLLTASQREANFLRMIDRKAPILYERSVVENAVRRYECFWLPMQVDAFNLLKNTVQKFEIPGPEGSTLFVIGGILFSSCFSRMTKDKASSGKERNAKYDNSTTRI
ncbi:Glycine-rich domain-containing protein [Dirofilaria immitis]